MTDRMSDAGGRLSRGPGLLLKTGRGLPTYRNDANFGRATGKMIKVGDLARDEDGFEDFNKYLEEDVFVSPPPTFTAKAKKPAKKSIVLMRDDSPDEFEPRDDDTPKQYFIKPPSRGPASSKKTAVPNRSFQHNSQIDYDSIPSPDTTRDYTSRKSVANTSVSRYASSKGKAKSAYLAEEEEEQNMGDSNMDETMGLDEPQMQFNQDDDDSGQDDVGGDYGMEVDDEPEPKPTPRAKGRKPEVEVEPEDLDQGYYGQNDYGNDAPMDDADSQQDEPQASESPRTRKARQKKEAKENEKAKAAKEKERSKKENRAPLRTKDSNVESKKRVRREFVSYDDEDGVRRGKRYRYKPLEFWRGEHIVVGRPTRDEPPVPIIHEIIRVPPEEVIHLGVQNRVKRRGTSKPISNRGGSRKAQEIYIENPEEGWDAETEKEAAVIDFETKEEVMRDIARTAASLNLQTPGNANYSFEKVFTDAEYLAGGIINIPVGSKKPNKPSNDNTYLFYCIEGAVKVKVHTSIFTISTGGMFMVPRGNHYLIQNICDRDCKIFFAQARKVSNDMVPSPTKRGSMAPKSGSRGSPATPITPSPSKPRRQVR